MTVAGFVNQKFLANADTSFTRIAEAADKAQTAFNMNADTPIRAVRRNARTREHLRELLNASRDAYRQAASYQGKTRSSRIEVSDVELTDLNKHDFNRVPIPGREVVLRVAATHDQVIIEAIESSRGLSVVSFDGWMKPTIAPQFRPFLMGDQIDVDGDLAIELGRGEPEQRYDEADDERAMAKRRRPVLREERADDDQQARRRRRPAPPETDQDIAPPETRGRRAQTQDPDIDQPPPEERATPKRRASPPREGDNESPPTPTRKLPPKESSIEDELQ